jgi:sec-independent protein translocase protein TatA
VIGDILQPTHLLFILVVALLVLGPKRLPEVGRSLGRGLRDFKAAVSGEERERQDDAALPEPAPEEASQPANESGQPAAKEPAQHVS